MATCDLLRYEYVKEEKENTTKYHEALLATVDDYLPSNILIL